MLTSKWDNGNRATMSTAGKCFLIYTKVTGPVYALVSATAIMFRLCIFAPGLVRVWKRKLVGFGFVRVAKRKMVGLWLCTMTMQKNTHDWTFCLSCLGLRYILPYFQDISGTSALSVARWKEEKKKTWFVWCCSWRMIITLPTFALQPSKTKSQKLFPWTVLVVNSSLYAC